MDLVSSQLLGREADEYQAREWLRQNLNSAKDSISCSRNGHCRHVVANPDSPNKLFVTKQSK